MWFSKKTGSYDEATTAILDCTFWMSVGTVSSKGVVGSVTGSIIWINWRVIILQGVKKTWGLMQKMNLTLKMLVLVNWYHLLADQ
jgi:hypothetical protein